MSVKIRPRRGTAAAWTAANPTLDTAEIGLETDTRKLKFGDAATAWNSLAYHNTDSVPESGAPTNKYFTDARARAAFSATAPVALSVGGVISMTAVTSLVDGYLSAADFVTLSAKVGTSRTINTTSPITGGGDLSADRTIAGDFTIQWTWTAINIATTPTDRIQLSNTQAAISGTQQISPALRLTGQGFGTGAGTSQAVDWRIYHVPVQGSTPTSNLLFQFSVAGGGFSTQYTFNSSGIFTAASDIVSGGLLQLAQGSVIRWGTGRSRMQSPSDGVIELSNAAVGDFTRLQFGGTTSSFPALARSSAILKVRLADDSADGALTCGAFSATGNISFFSVAAAAQQAVAALTNNVTAGGTNDTIADFTDLTLFANSAATIRNNEYQLARKLAQVVAALRLYGLLG